MANAPSPAPAEELLEHGDGLIELDSSWVIVRVNAAQERATGTRRAETLGRVFWEVWPEVAAPDGAQRRAYHRCMEERVPVELLDHHAPSGAWFHITAYPTSTGGIAVFFRDVTGHQRAEQSVRAERDFSATVLDTLATLVVVLDPEGRIVRFNAACERATGFAAPEVLGKSVFELLVPDADLPGTRETFRQLRVGDFPNQHRNRWRTRTGAERLIDWSNAAVTDGRGDVRFVIGTGVDVTERERSLEALRESEERFRSVFESAAVGVSRVSLEGRFLQVNEAFARLVGYTPEELGGMEFRQLTHPDDLAADLRLRDDLVAGRIPSYRMDKRYLRKDGATIWVSLSVGLARDAAGHPAYCSVVAEDVSARKGAEDAVRAAARAAEDERRRLATVLEALPAGVAITDAAGGFTHVNAEFRRIWGGPPSPRDVDEYGPWRGWWPDGRPIATAEWALSRALTTGDVVVPGQVVDIERFDGSGRATIVNAAAPIRDADGRITGAVLTEVDISRQRRAEATARAAEQRMRSVVEHLPSGLVVADLATHDLHWNAEALRIHGYTGEGEEHRFVESLVAEHDLRTLAGEPVPVPRWPLPRLLAGESFRDYELLVRNTRLRWERVFSYSGVIIPQEGGPALGLLAIQDVSARSRAEAGLRHANGRLQEADRRKDAFLGMLSHELRNPLAPIRNALYILDHAPPDGPQARHARDVARRQVAHLNRLVDDLLDVTRIARGKVELRREELDLGGLVRRAAEDYRALMHDRGLALAVDVPAAPVLVSGDPARLTQVLGNLLNNAAKFTPAGGRVSLSLRPEDGRAVVHVRDTGPGIADELLLTLFEPFTQGKQTLARAEGGLGLGLSLVRGLVAMHGGEVAVSNVQGGGADFVVSLGLSGAAAAAEVARPGSAPRAAAAARHRVLVVDDNRDAAETLGELMQMLGHEVEVAYDGPSAIADAGRTRPDLVLCDIGLPGMDGYQVARELRARHDGELRLVALSGYAQPDDVDRAIEAGFDAHVAKPPDPEQLAELVRARDPGGR